MYVSGGKKCQFSEKRFVRTKRIIAIYISYAAVNQYGPPDLRLLNIKQMCTLASEAKS